MNTSKQQTTKQTQRNTNQQRNNQVASINKPGSKVIPRSNSRVMMESKIFSRPLAFGASANMTDRLEKQPMNKL